MSASWTVIAVDFVLGAIALAIAFAMQAWPSFVAAGLLFGAGCTNLMWLLTLRRLK